jgi:Ni,Fe-hydrogenase I small subunit
MEFIKVYSGKKGSCCCGCSGTYWEKGDKMFSSMLKKVQNFQPKEVDSTFGKYAFVEVRNRLYVAYTY